MFCPKCGSILIPRKEKQKNVLACSCGFVDKHSETVSIKEVLKKTNKDIINRDVVEEDIEPHPVINVDCPKCKHTQAYYWTVQTRAGDEPETKFHKCKKCKHVWRDYR